MIDTIASLYQYIYIIVVGLFTIPIIRSYKITDGIYSYKYKDSIIEQILVVFILILFIGFRPLNEEYFNDMAAYEYQLRKYAGDNFIFNWEVDNKIFDNLLYYWSCNNLGDTSFFIFMATLYFGLSYIGIKRLFPTHTMPAYLVFLAAFSTFSYATNGLKAGAAASIFILALSFYKHKIVCVSLMLISLGFHHSMQLPLAAVILTWFYKNPKWYFYGWFVCFLIALFHITYFQNLFGSMTDEQGAGYLIVKQDETIGEIRFRPDFILYSVAPIWIGYQFEMKLKKTSEIYSALLHFYLCTNGIWMLCMYASFNNRIAYLSWFVYPIVLIYPFLYVDERSTRYRHFSNTVKYHLLFTIFMVFIYYGIFSLGN